MSRFRLRVIAVSMASCFAQFCFASPTGSISGFIKDPTASVIPGVKVTLRNNSTNAVEATTSDANGAFQFPQLAPSTYSLTAETPGFKKATISQILVQVDQATRADLSLEVGQVTDVMEVSAIAPLLENDKSTLSSVVDSNTIASMPLNARQFLDLALITPGTVPAGPGTQGGGFNAAGARSQSNIYLLDGVSNTDTQTNQPLANFRITEAVQEFNVQTSVPLPEFGRGAGAQVNIVTKSGSNDFHGSLFEYFRNTVLGAADFFSNKLGGTRSPLNRNQYGGTVGGPVIRNKTFFFASYEGFRQVAPTPSTTRVPTAAERAQVTDPISQRLLQFFPAPNASGTLNYIANVRSSDFDHTGLMKIDHNFNDRDHLSFRWAEFRGILVTPGTTPLSGGNTDNPVQRSFLVNEVHTISPTFLNEFRAGYSRNLTARTDQDQGLNAATLFTDAAGNPLPGVVNGANNLLYSGLPTITVNGGYAVLGTTSNYPQGRTTNTYEIFDNMSKVAPFGLAKHSFRWGFHMRREEVKRYIASSSRGVFTFLNWQNFATGQVNSSTIRTGNTLAYWRRYPFDLFWQDQYKVKDNLTLNYGVRYEYPSAIGELRNHAANFIPGYGPVVVGTNNLVTIDPTKIGPSSLVLQQAPFSIARSGVKPDKNNFAPMLGFAYTPRFAESIFGRDATVIRGGYRMAYDDLFNNAPSNMILAPPYNLATTQTANVTQPSLFPWAVGFNQNVPLVSNVGKQGPGTPTSGTIAFTAVDPNLRSAYLHQYNFGIQRRFGKAFSLEADYQGSSGHKLPIFIDINQPLVIVSDPTKRGPVAPNQQVFPYPSWGRVQEAKSIANSNYNGLVTTAKYQNNRGLFLQGSYTYSKSLDYNSSLYGSNGLLGETGTPADSTNLRLEHGPSAFDMRHHFVGVYVLDIPVGPGHKLLGWNNGISGQVFGGWQISGITTLQTGVPFTVVTGGADSSGFNQGNDRPNITRSGALTQDNRNPDNAFDKTYFTPAFAGKTGTSGRDQYYGPGLQNWDLAALKSFAVVHERVRLQLRGDFFNILNHTNFANPVATISNANFGKITQTVGTAIATSVGTTGGPTGGPRLVQLSLRLQF